MKVAVVVFPGTNCERETHHVLTRVFGVEAELVWHESTDLDRFDAVVLPGGFSYGDHLRTGAIARFSPVMREVERLARTDRLVLGICNGFQILLEAGLLPGVMLRNRSLTFRSQWVDLRVETTASPLTAACSPGQVLRMPIAHGEGNYFAEPGVLAALRRQDRVLLRYCEPDGTVSPWANPNGALENIAAICSEGRNVVALMPHPERACEPELGSSDGRALFASLLGAGVAVGAR